MTSKLISQSAIRNIQRYPLGTNHPGVYLTKRQAQCIKHLIEGKSVKEIGSILNLSPRTVDDYLKKLRAKLGCYRREQLIALIKNSDFHKHYAAINDLDERNYKAIQLLEFFGNTNPSQKQIDLMERLLAATDDFKWEV